ncbi:anaphase-promoting complex subunit 11 isoform 2-T2 [Chlamydotis macqueenii]
MRAARWLGLALLCLCRPTEPWYRAAAGPRHYSVGRASGLLASLRRSPHPRRSEPGPGAMLPGPAPPPARLHPTAPCVTDVAPQPRSCRVLPGARSALQCKADVIVSLDPVECADA